MEGIDIIEMGNVQSFTQIIADMHDVNIEFHMLPEGCLGAYVPGDNVIFLDLFQSKNSIYALSAFMHELGHVLHHRDNPKHIYYDVPRKAELAKKNMSKLVDIAVEAENETEVYAKELFKTFFPFHRYKKGYGYKNDRQRLKTFFGA